jgi:hypothetical protein
MPHVVTAALAAPRQKQAGDEPPPRSRRPGDPHGARVVSGDILLGTRSTDQAGCRVLEVGDHCHVMHHKIHYCQEIYQSLLA